MQFNEEIFFSLFRKSFGGLVQVQVDSIKSALKIASEGKFNSKTITIPQLAYILATAWHEARLKPIQEGKATREGRAKQLQAKYWHTGFYGRGFIQLTWEDNYKLMSDRLGIDLVANPDLALKPETAMKILFSWFFDGNSAGKKIGTYINSNKKSYKSARILVNNDVDFNGELIAGYARTLERILTQCLEAQPIPIPELQQRQVVPMISDIPEEVEAPEEVAQGKPKLTKPQAFTLVGLISWFCTDVLGIPLDYVTSALNYLLPYAQSKPFRWAVVGIGATVLYLYWKGYLLNIKSRFMSAIEGFKNAR